MYIKKSYYLCDRGQISSECDKLSYPQKKKKKQILNYAKHTLHTLQIVQYLFE